MHTHGHTGAHTHRHTRGHTAGGPSRHVTHTPALHRDIGEASLHLLYLLPPVSAGQSFPWGVVRPSTPGPRAPTRGPIPFLWLARCQNLTRTPRLGAQPQPWGPLDSSPRSPTRAQPSSPRTRSLLTLGEDRRPGPRLPGRSVNRRASPRGNPSGPPRVSPGPCPPSGPAGHLQSPRPFPVLCALLSESR